MKKIHIYILITVVFMFGCKNDSPDDFWFLKKDHNYGRIKQVFSNYIDFFPNSNQADCVNSTWSLDNRSEYNIKTIFSFSDSSFYKVLAEIKQKSIAEYLPTQECLLVLNRFGTHFNYGYPSKDEINEDLINLDCYNDLYPIPNFSNFSKYQTDSTECKLQDDFVMFVLESESGMFLEQDKLTDGKYMPAKWKNGYSKGVAVSEERKEIIYWIIIW